MLPLSVGGPTTRGLCPSGWAGLGPVRHDLRGSRSKPVMGRVSCRHATFSLIFFSVTTAIAQMKPSSSRATAVITTFFSLLRDINLKYL